MSALTTIRHYVEQANVALEAAVFEAEENEGALSERQMVSLDEAQATVYTLLMRMDAKLRSAQQPEPQP